MKKYKIKYYPAEISKEKREQIGREIFKIIEGEHAHASSDILPSKFGPAEREEHDPKPEGYPAEISAG